LYFTAFSLVCYTCDAQTSNDACKTQTICSGVNQQCMTTVATAGVGSLSYTSITKVCSPLCKATSFGTSVGSGSTSCCSTDLCNVSGATGVKYSFTALALSLGFLLVLLRN
ncbi:hypothetical protein GDO86_010666, partial [Hymenochirus boettgeri]